MNWFEYLSIHSLTIQVSAIVLSVLLLLVAESKLFHKIHPRLLRSQRIWDDAVLYALHTPFRIYLLFLGSLLIFLLFLSKFHSQALFVHRIVAFLLFIWALIRFVQQLEKNYTSPKKMAKLDPTTVTGMIHMLKVFVFAMGGLMCMQLIGIPLSGVIAFGGIGGIAVGFAAKDLLANLFGGLMIFLDRPFKIGDWIRSPDQEIEGTVEYIGWRLTRIRTFDRRPLFVPNSVFSTISLENPSRMSNRRIKARFGLSYEDASKVSSILADIEKMLKHHPEIDATKVSYVKLVDFGPYSLQIEIYVFTKTTDWLTFQSIQQDVFLKILEIINQHGTKCAYPATTLHIPGSGQKFPPN